SPIDLEHEAVDDAARRATRKGAGDSRVVFAGPDDGGLVGLGNPGLVTRQERGAQLHSAGAEGERRRDPAPVHDSARRGHGTATASTTWGTRAIVPTIAPSKSPANVPRWPPASLPCVTMASTPAFSSARASSTVVAVPIRNIPRSFTASRALSGSTPNVKLKTDAPLSS